MPRNGSRNVFNQGNEPTCGPTSCGMVLDTLGHPVDLPNLISRANVGPKGISANRIADLLQREGVDASFKSRMTIQDLTEVVRGKNPAIVAVQQGGGGHAIVVDGITKRYGIDVVAIRDPWGRQYFERLDIFEKRFLGQAITIGNK